VVDRSSFSRLGSVFHAGGAATEKALPWAQPCSNRSVSRARPAHSSKPAAVDA